MSNDPARIQPDNTADLPAPDALQAILDAALAHARRAGASAAEAATDAGQGLSVRVRFGEVDAVEFQADRELAVTLYNGQRKGSATTTDLRGEAIEKVVAQAWAIASHTGEDRWAGLAPAERMATEMPDLDLHHPWSLDVDAAVALARDCESAALAVDERIDNSEGAEVNSHDGIAAYANSHGFFGAQRATSHGLSCAVIARQDEQMQRDHWYTVARAAGDLDAASAVGTRAGERSVARLGAVTPKTTRAPVLLPPELARSLFGHFLSAISGAALYRDASFLKDRIGEQIFAPHIQLAQRPHLPRAMASAAFDAEGVATAERDLVVDGVLQGYVLGSYSARRLGLESTGNAGGVFNLCVAPGDKDFQALMRDMDTGFVATELMGHGVSTMTGDYSRGAAGFWVENGQIAYPVENVTIASSLQAMFANIVAVGSDVDTRSGIRAPSVLLDSMTVAGA